MPMSNALLTKRPLTADQRESIAECFSDMSKDAFGSRDRSPWEHMTDDELVNHFNYLERMVLQSIEEDNFRWKQAKNDFEAAIVKMMETGAKDRATAIRWLIQSEEPEIQFEDGRYSQEIDFALYKFHLASADANVYMQEIGVGTLGSPLH